jgi:hypothetical protein
MDSRVVPVMRVDGTGRIVQGLLDFSRPARAESRSIKADMAYAANRFGVSNGKHRPEGFPAAGCVA